MQLNRIYPRIYYGFTIAVFLLKTGNLDYLIKRSFIKVGVNKLLVRNLYDVEVIKETFYDKIYSPLFDNLRENTTYVDVGAYIGDTVIYASSFNKIKQIIAIEPLSENLNLLKKNLKKNQTESVQLLPKAIAPNDSELVLFVHPNRGQTGIHKLQDGVIQVKVAGITLDQVIKKAKYKNIILKSDCEGSEYPIFMSTPQSVLSKINKIIFEYHMNEIWLKDIVQRLEQIGFKVSYHKNPVESNLGIALAVKTKPN